MSLRTSFFTIGGGDESNWSMMTHPDLSDGDAYLFPSTTHNLLVYNARGTKIFKTDLTNITFLADLPVSSPEGICYNNATNQLVLLDEGWYKDTVSYVSTDMDLSTYTTGTLPTDAYRTGAQLNGELIYGNGYYVIGGEYNPSSSARQPAIFYSTNGISWTRLIFNTSTSIKTGTVKVVGFGNNKFVAFGSYFTGTTDYSSKAVAGSTPTSWTKAKSDFSGHVRISIVYCNGYFYHYNWSDKFIRSSDGTNWSELTKPEGFNAEHYSFNVLYYNGLYYIIDQSRIYSTSDFSTYKKYKMPFTSTTWYRQSMVIVGDTIVVMRGNKVYHSKISELVEDI